MSGIFDLKAPEKLGVELAEILTDEIPFEILIEAGEEGPPCMDLRGWVFLFSEERGIPEIEKKKGETRKKEGIMIFWVRGS
jgi:hypothetical protein